MKKKTVVFCVLGLLTGGCRSSERPHSLKLSGTLEMTEYSLGPRVSGKLSRLLVDEGQEVKKDETLAALDRYDQSQRDYDRASALFRQGGGTRQALEQAQLTLDDQRVVSPVDGVVLLKIHEPGEVVAAGSPVVVVGDRSQLWVRVYVSGKFINQVTMGQAAEVRLDGLDKTFPGKVSFIAPRAEFTPRNVQTPEERITQTFAVKVVLDHPEIRIRPGVPADVVLTLTP